MQKLAEGADLNLKRTISAEKEVRCSTMDTNFKFPLMSSLSHQPFRICHHQINQVPTTYKDDAGLTSGCCAIKC
jgi:hypothetical protein